MVTSHLTQISSKNESSQGRWLIMLTWFNPQVVLRIIQLILKRLIMEVIFLIYLSKFLMGFGRKISYYLCIDLLSENDSIFGSIKDLFSVCVRDCMGSIFTTHLVCMSLQVVLRIIQVYIEMVYGRSLCEVDRLHYNSKKVRCNSNLAYCNVFLNI